MHELSVTENILNITLKHAREANASKVTDIHIVIGQLSSIVDESVDFYWKIISEDTICSDATLHFKRIPAEFFCTDCKSTFPLEQELAPCPHCGSVHINIVSGEEFYLDSIEIERQSE
ncbi:MAG: hydrogenase maturation nickel metallochaperone HypA [Anaerolineae bacterium]|nr:hydrogenase maturation nickel metallochaperone HypA [Anaerolineae bacterium]